MAKMRCFPNRVSRVLALSALAVSSLACQGSTRPAARGAAPPAQYAAAQYPLGQYSAGTAYPAPPAALPTMERHWAPQASRQFGSALLFLPGSARQQQVTFETVNGQAVLDGDMMLGPATALAFRYGNPSSSSIGRKSAVAVASRTYLWPNAEIPYSIDASAQPKTAEIDWAVQVFRSTSLKLRPRTAADRDYVVFRDLASGCWSYLGRQGGPQDIDISSCIAGSIAHELMHAAGFYHEQSRGDRDAYITIMWDEVSPEVRSNFEKRDARGQDIGPYDYGSIMHYPSHAGSQSGRATIVPRQANAKIGQRDGLSPLDVAAITTLYGSAPAAVAAQPSFPPTNSAPSVVPAYTPPQSPPSSSPVPVAAPTPSPTSAPATSGSSFAGTYDSSRGAVSCTQGGTFVQCQYPGGSMFCAAGASDLACTWSGGGQGRATFQRQANGVAVGTWGDAFSTDSRGRWDLVPRTATAAAPAPAAPAPAAPASAPRPPAAAPVPAHAPSVAVANASLSGNYTSTRGPLSCVESGASVSCNFQEPDGVSGRLDCTKSQDGLELSCAWITFLPRPATGRAQFKRASARERRLTGTWGPFFAASGGGSWDLQGQ